MTDYRTRCFETHDRVCMECASKQNIEVHHVDGDRNNNDPDNLVPLCRDCHTKLNDLTLTQV
jgi:5-methylcytosine-specific restriction endonuclease McrA